MAKKNTHFVSELDQFMADFDHQHPEKSVSQLADIKKHQRIFKLRDEAKPKKDNGKIWEEF